MRKAVDWSWLRKPIPVVDMAMYLDMPEDVARTVEIRDGMILHRESPSPNHVAISDNIKGALREAVSKRPSEAPCMRASGELDMLVSEVPFHYKRPDAIVHRCIDEPRGRWKTKPMASDTLFPSARRSDEAPEQSAENEVSLHNSQTKALTSVPTRYAPGR
ncbi:hypothetical protein ACIBG0_00860 [Nocardia sp. NPDC050630]|uniref:hypothetical protein n=1 Tax=Nocardia sp. NPDC050630 TaxID=3364321 RepID=UPI0037885B43